MIEWFIVIAFWADDGSLQRQSRAGFASEEQCEQAIPRDLAEFKRQFGNGSAKCNASPPRPKGLPEPKPEGKDA